MQHRDESRHHQVIHGIALHCLVFVSMLLHMRDETKLAVAIRLNLGSALETLLDAPIRRVLEIVEDWIWDAKSSHEWGSHDIHLQSQDQHLTSYWEVFSAFTLRSDTRRARALRADDGCFHPDCRPSQSRSLLLARDRL